MTALRTVPQAEMTASQLASPELWRLLTTRSFSFHDALNVLSDVKYAAEMGRLIGRIEAEAAPCGTQEVIRHLTPLVTLYGLPNRSEAEWRTFWQFYANALGDLPSEAVRRGVEDYVNAPDSEFFPRPGPLKQLCLKRAETILMAWGRIRKAYAGGNT